MIGLLSIGTSAYVGPSGGGYQLNASQIAYFAGNSPFLNLWNAQGFTQIVASSSNGSLTNDAAWTTTGTGGAAYFNPATAELNNPCPADVTSITRIIFTPPPTYSILNIATPWWQGKVINVTWVGTSTPILTGASGATLASTGANSATITLASNASNVSIQFPVSNASNPPRSIVAYFSQYSTNIGNGEIWNPDWVNLVKQFGYLRFMKMTGGGQSYQSDISQLADANYTFWGAPFTSTSFTTGWGQTPPVVPTVGGFGNSGPKGGLHPSMIVNLCNAHGINPWFNVPVATTTTGMQAIAQYFQQNLNPNLHVVFEYGNETCFAFGTGPTTYVQNSTYPGTGTSGNAALTTGYNSAILWNTVNNVFGKGGRARWKGCASGQEANFAAMQSVITGAQYAIANVPALAGVQLTDLYDFGIVANYYGGGTSAADITAATAVGATTTLTTTQDMRSAFPVSSVIRLFFSVTTAGTLGALLNNVDVTVSAVTSTSISFTNFGGNSGSGAVNTTGLTYSAGTNYLASGLLFDLMDNSLANFNSTPAVYPTKYAYFTAQMWKAIITGATDNGYIVSNPLAGIQQNQLVANGYGLQLRFYEGSLSDLTNSQTTGTINNNSQYKDYANNYKFDAGVVSGPLSAYNAAAGAAFNTALATQCYSSFPSQFDSTEEPPLPWTPLRFFPGDETNPLWASIVAQNALGPWVDPTLPATGTYNQGAVSGQNNNVATQTFTVNFGSNPANSLAVLCFGAQSGTPTGATNITLVGNSTVNIPSATPDVVNGTTAIYSGVLPANMGSTVITVVWSNASFIVHNCCTYLLTGLVSNTVQSTATGTQTATIAEVKGSAVVVAGGWAGAQNTITAGPLGGPSLSQTLAQINAPLLFSGSTVFVFPFSSNIMRIATTSGSLAVATYR